MPLSLDLIILAFLIFMTFLNYKKGVLKGIYGIISFILSIVLTKMFHPELSRFLKSSVIFEKLNLYFIDLINFEKSLKPIIENSQQSFIESLNFPSSLKEFFLGKDFGGIIDLNLIEQNLASYISSIIINIFSLIFIYLAVVIVLKILGSFFGFAFNLPFLNKMNKILGGALGFLKSIILIWFVFIIISFLTINPDYTFIKDAIYETNIAKYFYENNYLLLFILKYFT